MLSPKIDYLQKRKAAGVKKHAPNQAEPLAPFDESVQLLFVGRKPYSLARSDGTEVGDKALIPFILRKRQADGRL